MPSDVLPFLLGTLLFFAFIALIVLVVAAGGILLFVRARLLPLALSVLGGVGVGALLHGGAVVGIVTTLALLAVFESLRKPLRRQQQSRQRFDIEATATKAPGAQAPAPRQGTDPALDTAWEALARNADWAVSRVAVARESCRLFLATTDRAPYDSNAADLAVRIRRRVPEHIAECLDRCEHVTPSERRAILDECVATAEKVGAEADRQRARLRGPADAEISVQRRHLTRPAPDDPFAVD